MHIMEKKELQLILYISLTNAKMGFTLAYLAGPVKFLFSLQHLQAKKEIVNTCYRWY